MRRCASLAYPSLTHLFFCHFEVLDVSFDDKWRKIDEDKKAAAAMSVETNEKLSVTAKRDRRS